MQSRGDERLLHSKPDVDFERSKRLRRPSNPVSPPPSGGRFLHVHACPMEERVGEAGKDEGSVQDQMGSGCGQMAQETSPSTLPLDCLVLSCLVSWGL